MTVKSLALDHNELVTLMLLTSIGATSFDAPMGIAHELKRRYEKKFGVEIDASDIASIINKVGDLLKADSGEESVVIGG